MKITLKPKNMSRDKSELENIEGKLSDAESDDSVEDAEEEEEEVSDESVGDNDSDENEDLGETATESDEDDSDEDETTTDEPSLSKSEMIKRTVLQKYQESHGKRLYIRFPRSVTDKELEHKAKELSPLIINVHKPRQKYARFCLVDFETKDDRDATLKALKKLIKKGELEKYRIDIPRTESADYVQHIAELKIKSLENKKVKARLKRASNKADKVNSFTSTVLVFNLPKTATVIQVRELFPGAVDVQIKALKGGVNKDKSIAVITLSSTMEARAAVKRRQLSLGGNQLTVKFDNQKIKKRSRTKPQQMKKPIQPSVKDDVSSDNEQALPAKTSKPIATMEKEKTRMPQPKTPNKKRKLLTTENVPHKNTKKNLNKLPKNKGITTKF